MLNGFGEAAGTIRRDRSTIKRDPQIVAHGLHAPMLFAVKPRQHSVPWEIIYPVFERVGHVDSQRRSLMEDGRARIRREDVGPEFSSGELLADIHHEGDGLTPFFIPPSGIPENDIEGWNDAGLDAAFSGFVDVLQHLKILVHE